MLRLLAWVTGLRVLRALVIEDARGCKATCEGYTHGFQSARALRRFAADPRTEISPGFVSEAIRRGDACYGVCRGGRLISSSWYSTRPTPIGPPEAVAHFDAQWVYMYKAFTQPSHRGRRLYEAGVRRALEHYRAKGARGLLSYVEATNLDSLAALRRMGFRIFGSAYLLRLFGRQFAFSSPGCRRYGCRVETASPRPAFAAKEAPLGR
ncbi:MAG TPA: GNAT family N-acetyltransferase [Burkholderiales bacterium]